MRRQSRPLVTTLAASLLALVVAGLGSSPTQAQVAATKPGADKRQLTVMTQNLYLGSSLGPALEAESGPEFVAAVAQIYGTAVFTDFPRRAKAVADTIATERPDLIGLQEVTRWTATPTRSGPMPRSYDFLTILQSELAARGLDYRVGSVVQNADIGPAPLVAPPFGCMPPPTLTAVPDCVVSLLDRDVILYDATTPGLAITGSASGRFVAQEVLALPDGTSASFARGWTYVDTRFEGKKLRFLNTHLEVEDFAATQEAQGREFLAGPARAPGAVVAVGDFNSAADPATTSTPTTTYADLSRFFTDAWTTGGTGPGLTCCQTSALTNTTSALRTRIDLVLLRGPVRARSARVVGDTPIPGASSPPFWASDHAGVVATVRVH